MIYILGHLTDPDALSDFQSANIQDVYQNALRLSDESPEDSFGIWANDGEDLIAIAHNGEIFRK